MIYIVCNHSSVSVFATCRNPAAPKSSGLLELQSEFGGDGGRLKIQQLDAAKPEDIDTFG